jgi:predicted acetyltransferase
MIIKGADCMSEVKIVDNATNAEIYNVVKYAFHKEPARGKENFMYYLANVDKYVATDEGKIQSFVASIPFNVNFFGSEMKATGIGYVSSLPESRGKGFIHQIFERYFEEEYSRGTILSYLDPFSYSFYRQFGYEHVFDYQIIEMTGADFPKVGDQNFEVRRVSYEEALPYMKEVSEQYEPNARGGMKREDWWWKLWFQLRQPDLNFALVFDRENCVGYVMYRFEGMTFEIIEWRMLCLQALKQSIHFISGHAGAFDRFTYTLYSGDIADFPMLDLMPEKRLKRTLGSYMQARIINVEEFLSRYPYQQANISFSLRVHDDKCPWNDSFYSVVVDENKKGHAEKVIFPDYSLIYLSEPTLVKLFFGKRTLEQLEFIEEISFGEKNVSLDELQKIFVNKAPILDDVL